MLQIPAVTNFELHRGMYLLYHQEGYSPLDPAPHHIVCFRPCERLLDIDPEKDDVMANLVKVIDADEIKEIFGTEHGIGPCIRSATGANVVALRFTDTSLVNTALDYARSTIKSFYQEVGMIPKDAF